MVISKRLTLYLIIMLCLIFFCDSLLLVCLVVFFFFIWLLSSLSFVSVCCIALVLWCFDFQLNASHTHTRFEIHLACYYVASEIISLATAQPCIDWKKQNILVSECARDVNCSSRIFCRQKFGRRKGNLRA